MDSKADLFVDHLSHRYADGRVAVDDVSFAVAAGESVKLSLSITGDTPTSNLSLQFSDNEFNNGTTRGLVFTPGLSSLASLNGSEVVTIKVSAASTLAPGRYIAAITLTNGLVLNTLYVTVDVAC